MGDLEKNKSGKVMPFVDFNRCEGKAPCMEVCPENVFDIRHIDDEEFGKLSFLGKFKTKVKGRKKAYVINQASCIGCGKCIKACPEKAIKFIKYSA